MSSVGSVSSAAASTAAATAAAAAKAAEAKAAEEAKKVVTGKLTKEQIERLDEISKDKDNNDKLKGQALDKDAFLKILMTQIQHQDPMSPLQDSEFIGQMAQFSSVEQMSTMSAAATQTNQTLDAIGILMTNMNTSLAEMNKKLGDGSDTSNSSNKDLLDQLKLINESITKLTAKIE